MKRVSAGHEANDAPTVRRSETMKFSMPACLSATAAPHAGGTGTDDDYIIDDFTALCAAHADSSWRHSNQTCCELLPHALLVEVAADEDELIATGRVAPGLIRLAVKEHMHPLKDEATRLTREADEALHAEDVHPALTEQFAQARR